MSVKLSEGALTRISNGEKIMGPILQIIDIRVTQAASGQSHGEKYRLTVSDGVHSHLAYVATQSTHMFADRTIQRYHIVRLQEYCVSVFSNTKFIIIARIEPIQPFTEVIGNPVPVGTAPAPAPAPAAAPTAAAPAAAAVPAGLPRPTIPAAGAGQGQAPMDTRPPASPLKSTNNIISSPARRGQKVFTDATPVAGAGEAIVPIKSLHPYQNVWTIRARVTNKSAMKEFARKTGGGVGKLFSVELIDEAGDEIRATAFTEVADKLYGVLEVGRVYLISRGTLKVANKRFTTIAHPFEITFNESTSVTPVADDASTAAIPSAHYAFVPIAQIAALNKDDLVDVLGVVTEASDVQNLVQKSTGRDLVKRTLTLLDTSAHTIEVTLWGEKAAADGIAPGTVVAVRAARVGTFNTKSLSTTASSQLVVAPAVPEAKQLAAWYAAGGATTPATAISVAGGSGSGSGEGGAARDDSVKTIAAVIGEQLGMGSQVDYFSCVACITAIRHNQKISYSACPDPKCGGKVTMGTDGQFFCAKCNKSMAQAAERYMLHVQLADATGSIWVTCFNDTALRIMDNRDAAELIALQTQGNEAEFDAAFDDAAHKWYAFRVRAKMDTYREEVRAQYSVVSATPIDYPKECKRLVSIIDSYPQA